MIGRKQYATHEQFVEYIDAIRDGGGLYPRDRYDALLERTVAAVKTLTTGKRAAFGWSGGKDSLALEVVCKRAGIHRCVFGMTDHLEYPAFLQWVTDHMPPGLTVLKNGWDLDWLAAHQPMLFPQTSAIAGRWFSGVQHRAQREYYQRQRLDVLLLGRRRIDGNHVGTNAPANDGGAIYTDSDGLVRYSPLADWSHEDVLACLVYEDLVDALPPFYRWPRGFRCGTHPWPARQWCNGIAHGWREVHSIDASIVVEAARKIDSARAFLDSI